MMKNHLKISLLLVVINIISVNAQIGNEIMNYTDSTEFVMNNGQKLLMQSLLNKDYPKVTNVYYYLQEEMVKQGLLAFSYTDILYINLTSQNWNEFFDYIRNYKAKIQLPVYKHNSSITSRLYTIAKDEAEHTILAAEEAGLSKEDLTLIKLFFQVVQKEELDKEYGQLKSQFKQRYPSSSYTSFVTDFLPNAPTKASWAWGMGATMISPTGNYGDNFYNGTMFNMSSDFNVGSVYVSLYINAGNVRARESFSINNQGFKEYQFDEGDDFTYFDGGLQLGYLFVNNTHIHVVPYATIGGASLRSNIYHGDERHYDDEYDIISTFIYGAGLHTQVKLFEFDSPYYSYMYNPYIGTINSYVALKLNVGYNALTSSRCDFSKGNMLYAQIGLVWGFGQF